MQVLLLGMGVQIFSVRLFNIYSLFPKFSDTYFHGGEISDGLAFLRRHQGIIVPTIQNKNW